MAPRNRMPLGLMGGWVMGGFVRSVAGWVVGLRASRDRVPAPLAYQRWDHY